MTIPAIQIVIVITANCLCQDFFFFLVLWSITTSFYAAVISHRPIMLQKEIKCQGFSTCGPLTLDGPRRATKGQGLCLVSRTHRKAFPGPGNLSLERSGCKIIGFHGRTGPTKLATSARVTTLLISHSYFKFDYHKFTMLNVSTKFYKIEKKTT